MYWLSIRNSDRGGGGGSRERERVRERALFRITTRNDETQYSNIHDALWNTTVLLITQALRPFQIRYLCHYYYQCKTCYRWCCITHLREQPYKVVKGGYSELGKSVRTSYKFLTSKFWKTKLSTYYYSKKLHFLVGTIIIKNIWKWRVWRLLK